MNRLRTAFVAILVLGIVGVAEFLVAPPVAAHTHVRQGEYELTVGWRVEPAIVGSLNGLDLGIQDHLANGTVVRVEGVESNLTATLKTGPATVLKALTAAWSNTAPRPGSATLWNGSGTPIPSTSGS